MDNLLKRDIPDYIEGYGKVRRYFGRQEEVSIVKRKETRIKKRVRDDKKLYEDIDTLLDKLDLKNGMCISFHHHLRNGDFILNLVMENIAKRGYKDITIAPSSIFPCHKDIVRYIEDGTITQIYTGYMSGPVAEAVSMGKLRYPAVMHSHGGRARLMESGELEVDIAFLGAPTSDDYGNISGKNGKSACGSLGYAHSDADNGKVVVAITDTLVEYPNEDIEIDQTKIDYVLVVDAIGDPNGIVSGTTKITKNPIGLKIAKLTSTLIDKCGYIKDGMTFQTGAGGISLGVAKELEGLMIEKNVVGAFASGGITEPIVNMYEKGLFKNLLDVQCFDLEAIRSIRDNKNHYSMSASMYANENNKGAVVDKLDVVILGATEIDLNFNVNVHTGSNGVIIGGSGGHSDTASGSKLCIIVSQLMNSRISVVKDSVGTVTTPGNDVDVLVTELGIAINPNRKDLLDRLKGNNLPLKTIGELRDIAKELTGVGKEIEYDDKIVAVVEYRDGSVVDVIKKKK